MTYLKRYLAGEHEAVWRDLSALQPACGPDIIADAEAVAAATMERVAANIDRLIKRLAVQGYAFGLYPGGEKVPGFRGPRRPLDADEFAAVGTLEEQAGTVPLSLRAFWRSVGEVNLVGRAPGGGLPDYSDPLWIEGPAAGLEDLDDIDPDDEGAFVEGGYLCPIAPDLLHKDNVSGGAPYSICLPNEGFDAIIQDEWHETSFVSYLRIAILDWGGFPGLSAENPYDKWRGAQDMAGWVGELKQDLIAF